MPAEHPLLTKIARNLVLSEAEAEAVRAVPVNSMPVKAHQAITREGDRPSHCFLMLDGVACTAKVVAGGKRQIMALHIAGDMPDLHSIHLELLDSDIWAISECRIGFIAHKDLRALNREHRGKDEPTDVLSFPIDEDSDEPVYGERELGDVIISPEHTTDLREAIVHGVLHLTGMDHETDEGEMLALQREILSW